MLDMNTSYVSLSQFNLALKLVQSNNFITIRFYMASWMFAVLNNVERGVGEGGSIGGSGTDGR